MINSDSLYSNNINDQVDFYKNKRYNEVPNELLNNKKFLIKRLKSHEYIKFHKIDIQSSIHFEDINFVLKVINNYEKLINPNLYNLNHYILHSIKHVYKRIRNNKNILYKCLIKFPIIFFYIKKDLHENFNFDDKILNVINDYNYIKYANKYCKFQHILRYCNFLWINRNENNSIDIVFNIFKYNTIFLHVKNKSIENKILQGLLSNNYDSYFFFIIKKLKLSNILKLIKSQKIDITNVNNKIYNGNTDNHIIKKYGKGKILNKLKNVHILKYLSKFDSGTLNKNVINSSILDLLLILLKIINIEYSRNIYLYYLYKKKFLLKKLINYPKFAHNRNVLKIIYYNKNITKYLYNNNINIFNVFDNFSKINNENLYSFIFNMNLVNIHNLSPVYKYKIKLIEKIYYYKNNILHENRNLTKIFRMV